MKPPESHIEEKKREVTVISKLYNTSCAKQLCCKCARTEFIRNDVDLDSYKQLLLFANWPEHRLTLFGVTEKMKMLIFIERASPPAEWCRIEA